MIPGKLLEKQALALARLTRELAHCCVAKESEIFSRFGLSTSEGNVLLAVAGGASSPSALADQLGVVRSRITPLVQHLFEKGFLERTELPSDRRVRELRLTGEGELITADAERYRLGFHQRLLERFEESERQVLFHALSQLHDRMTEIRRGMRDEKPETLRRQD